MPSECLMCIQFKEALLGRDSNETEIFKNTFFYKKHLVAAFEITCVQCTICIQGTRFLKSIEYTTFKRKKETPRCHRAYYYS